jgi:hypothetical protein
MWLRGLFSLLLLFTFSPAFACEDELRASPRKISADHLELQRTFNETPHPERMLKSDFDRLVRANLTFPISGYGDERWAVLFDPEKGHHNKGYYVSGKMENGNFLVQKIRRARNDEQREYYKKVARAHKLESEKVYLQKPILGCKTLLIEDWVSAKLWLKHGLTREDLEDVLNHPHSKAILDTEHTPTGYAPRYVIHGRSKTGTPIQVVISDQGFCPKLVITAYEESEYSASPRRH